MFKMFSISVVCSGGAFDFCAEKFMANMYTLCITSYFLTVLVMISHREWRRKPHSSELQQGHRTCEDSDDLAELDALELSNEGRPAARTKREKGKQSKKKKSWTRCTHLSPSNLPDEEFSG